MVSWLALIAVVAAWWRRDRRRSYLVAFWAVPATLVVADLPERLHPLRFYMPPICVRPGRLRPG